MTHHVFENKLIPVEFKFPKSFIQLVRDQTVTRIGPWWFLHRYPDSFHFWIEELRDEYPSRLLVPFAKFSVFDDIACFDGADSSGDPKIFYAFNGASPRWYEHNQGSHSHFERWIEQAKRDAEQWKAEGRGEF